MQQQKMPCYVEMLMLTAFWTLCSMRASGMGCSMRASGMGCSMRAEVLVLWTRVYLEKEMRKVYSKVIQEMKVWDEDLGKMGTSFCHPMMKMAYSHQEMTMVYWYLRKKKAYQVMKKAYLSQPKNLAYQ